MSAARSCPLGCGYSDPIPACVRLHLIQHHNYGYIEAQEAYPNDATLFVPVDQEGQQ